LGYQLGHLLSQQQQKGYRNASVQDSIEQPNQALLADTSSAQIGSPSNSDSLLYSPTFRSRRTQSLHGVFPLHP
jgi:hypothetical protein